MWWSQDHLRSHKSSLQPCANESAEFLVVDSVRSRTMGKERGISSADSNLKAFVVHTDEELIITRETARLIEDTEK